MKVLAMFLAALAFGAQSGFAAELKVGEKAPLIKLQTDQGKPFSLADRKGKWTVLYFYPKADTPGCTKEACAYRDSIHKIRELGAEVYGISADSVEDISKFRDKYHLNFPLLADPKLEAIQSFEVKRGILDIARRSTFVIDPELKIRSIEQDVDPVKNIDETVQKLKNLQTGQTGQTRQTGSKS